MAAQTPQAGIIPELNQHALFLVTRVNNPTTSRGAVADVAGIPELVTEWPTRFHRPLGVYGQFWIGLLGCALPRPAAQRTATLQRD